MSTTLKFNFEGDFRRIPVKESGMSLKGVTDMAVGEFCLSDAPFPGCRAVQLRYKDRASDLCLLSPTSYMDWYDAGAHVQQQLVLVAVDDTADCIIGYAEPSTAPTTNRTCRPSPWASNCTDEEKRRRREMFASFRDSVRDFVDAWRESRCAAPAAAASAATAPTTARSACTDRATAGPHSESAPFEPKGPKPLFALLRAILKTGSPITETLLTALLTHFLPVHMERVKCLMTKVKKEVESREFPLTAPLKNFCQYCRDVVVCLEELNGETCNLSPIEDAHTAVACLTRAVVLLDDLSKDAQDVRLPVCKLLARKLAKRQPLLKRFLLESNFLADVPVVDPTMVLHRSVRCDECGCRPIADIRFKCNECADFDLCATCYVNGTTKHSAAHTFKGLLRPCLRIKPKQCGVTPSEQTVYEQCPPPFRPWMGARGGCDGAPAWRKHLAAARDGTQTSRSWGGGRMQCHPVALTERRAACMSGASSGDEDMRQARRAMRMRRMARRQAMMSGASSGEEGVMNHCRARGMWRRQAMMSGASSGDEDMRQARRAMRMRRMARRQAMMSGAALHTVPC